LALLIGVQGYPKLDAVERLRGCRNDVEAMKNLLLRFGFKSQDMTVLIDDQATSGRVREALTKLVSRVQSLPPNGPKPQIVFYFSGHGALMPDQPEGDPDCDKEDGVDATIVPYDADKQGSDKDVRDDELMHFAEGICRDNRATLLLVLDCCHSGRGVRGIGKYRGLERHFAIPQPVSGGKRRITPKVLPAGAVVLSACRKEEKEPEYEEEGQSHGLMTLYLTRVLSNESALSRLDYELLRAALIRRYQDSGVMQAPTPTLEGDPGTLRSPVLAADRGMDRTPVWPVEAFGNDPGVVRLVAGLPHGVTKGSLYEIYEKPEQVATASDQPSTPAKSSAGWCRVESVDGTSSIARVFEWDESKKTQEETVLAGSFRNGVAVERYHDNGDIAIKLRVVRALGVNADGPPLGPDDPAVPEIVRDALTHIQDAHESAWLKWMADQSACDVVLRIDGNYAAIVPATGGAALIQGPPAPGGRIIPASLIGGWGPIELTTDDQAQTQLRDYLRRIARVRNLLRMAAPQNAQAPSARGIQVELMSVKLTQAQNGTYSDVTGWSPWPTDHEGALVVKKGKYFAVRVKNSDPAGKPWYATVLLVDPDMRIETIFPEREVIGEPQKFRVDPGDANAHTTEPYVCNEPFGRQTLIVLATREPNSFAFLAQPALDLTRVPQRNVELFDRILEGVYFQKTRGRPVRRPIQNWSAATLSWEAKP
jgi:hypothetical protein